MNSTNIETVAEHSVNLELLPEQSNILDLGCRGFEFERHFSSLGHFVCCVDADPQIKDVPNDANFFRMAISNEEGECAIQNTVDPQARHIIKGIGTKKMTIESFTETLNKNNIGKIAWDLIKIDIEGEEFNILKSSKHPIAKQVSVEFHAHCRIEQTKQSIEELLKELEQYYTVHNAVWETRHSAGYNFWDVLLIAK